MAESLVMQQVCPIPEPVYREIADFPGITLYHTRAWHAFLERTFGWTVRALLWRGEQGELRCFLPYVTKRGMNFKPKNLCLPLSHRVGPLWAPGAAAQLPGNLPPGRLEIHDEVAGPGLVRRALNKVVLLDLQGFAGSQDLFRVLGRDSIQRKIRKAEQSGVTAGAATDREAYETFYEMEVDTRIKQGSPIYPRPFFTRLFEAFQDTGCVQLYFAHLNGRPVAGVIFFHFNRVSTYAYGASWNNPDHFRLGVNQAVMWEALCDSMRRGSACVDFGSAHAANANLLDYKVKWGGSVRDLPYTFAGFGEAAGASVNREGALARAVSAAIRRMPRPVFKTLTPLLLKTVV